MTLLKELVSVYSPTGSEKAACQLLNSWFSKNNITSSIDEAGNVIAEKKGTGNTILFVGHIDTVPGEIKVKEEDGLLYGRGSVDAKACLAAFAEAMIETDCNVIYVAAVDEEGASKGARAILGKYKPDYIIIGEPSGWSNITIGYKGMLRLKYSAKKEIFHTAGNDTNSKELAVAFYNNLKEYCDNHSEGVFNSLNITLESINSSDDGFCEQTEMIISFRIPPGFNITEFKSYIASIQVDITLEYLSEEQPIKAKKANKLVSAFISAIRNNNGNPKFKLKTGTSDMNILGNHYDVPIIAYGPGDSNLDHNPNEHISLEEYDKSMNIIKEVITKIG